MIMDRFLKEMLSKLIVSDNLFPDVKKSIEKLKDNCYAFGE